MPGGTASNVLRLIAFCALLAAGFPSQSYADVTVTEDTIKWYEIRGNSIRELHKSLRRNSPVKQFDAYTRWFVDWRFSWRGDGKQCRLTEATVQLRINIDFPRLEREASMPADVLRKWKSYSSALMAHELTHARHGREAAEAIEAMLLGFSIPGGCNGMEAAANAAAMKIIREGNRLDKDYDRRTKHGATEGAVLH